MYENIHELKTDPIPFGHTDAGKKTVEVRLDDREYLTGDYILLRETRYTGEEMAEHLSPLEYTGYSIMTLITHIHGKEGMNKGWIAMSLKVLRNTGRKYAS
jgi:hypothetical protein